MKSRTRSSIFVALVAAGAAALTAKNAYAEVSPDSVSLSFECRNAICQGDVCIYQVGWTCEVGPNNSCVNSRCGGGGGQPM
jgi:hypothetical protein